jgi:hypothetical protein
LWATRGPDLDLEERFYRIAREPYFHTHIQSWVLTNLRQNPDLARLITDPEEIASILFEELAQNRRLGITPDVYERLPSHLANRLTWRLRSRLGPRRRSARSAAGEEPVLDYLAPEQLEALAGAGGARPEQAAESGELAVRVYETVESRFGAVGLLVLQLHLSGETYESIAKQVGWKRKQVDDFLHKKIWPYLRRRFG